MQVRHAYRCSARPATWRGRIDNRGWACQQSLEMRGGLQRGWVSVFRPGRCATRWIGRLVCLTALTLTPGSRATAEPKKALATIEGSDEVTAIRQRVEQNDFDGALERLDALPDRLSEQNGFRYLRARLYERKERIRDALAVIPDELESLPEVVARDIRRRRALWLARTGKCAEARPMLTTLARFDGPDVELTLRASDCAVLQNDVAAALVLLRDARAAGSKRFAVRQSLAKLYVQIGDRDSALRELRALYADFPTHSHIPEIEAQLRSLVPDWQPSNEEHLLRAEHWLDAARPQAALDELALVTLPKARSSRERQAQRPDQARILHLKGMALFKLRSRYMDAHKVLTQAAAMGSTTKVSDTYHAARALARADRDRDAVRAYYAFAKQYPKEHMAAEALHDAAWLELRHDMPGGEEHMRAFLKRAEKSGARHTIADSLWMLAMHAYKHQRYKDALPLFERYATTAEGSMVRARGLYWAGRAAAQSGKAKQALDHYREVLSLEPLHWYSLLASGRMRDAGEDPGPPFSAALSGEGAEEPPLDLRTIPLPDAARFYAELGLREDAVRALRAEEQQLRARGPGGLLRLIMAYHALGEFSRPFHLAERERDDVILKPPSPEQRPIWDALFPRPYADEVARAATAASVPPALVYAVMRKESAFNPTVVSYADAIGLMQLIEPTAKSNALDMGMLDFERDKLYEPAINVQLGSHYLAKLIAHYQGEAVPAIAAYNAGEHKVDPWLKRATRPDKSIELDYFVEDIPFEQTRNYVKGVVSSWARYAYLEKPGKDWPLSLSLRLKL